MLSSQILRVLFIVLCFGFCVSLAHAQNDPPTHPINGQFIKEWLVLGPFFPDDLETDFLVDVGGEAKVNPKEGDSVTTEDGRTLMWKRYTAKGNAIDLIDAIGYHPNATAMPSACCKVKRPPMPQSVSRRKE